MNPYIAFAESVLSEPSWQALAELCQRGEAKRGERADEHDQLERLGLARQHLMGWSPTWLGYGVNNWRLQQELALYLDPTAPLPEPTEYENGEGLGPLCARFREAYFRRGSCWCGRHRSQHPDQVVEIAQQFLQEHNQSIRLQKLQLPPAQVALTLPPVGPLETAVLQGVKDGNGRALSLGELSLKLSPLFGFFELKVAVDRLLELELLVASGDQLYTTWEGRRLINSGFA